MRLLAAVMAVSTAALAQTAPTSNDQEAARAHFMAGSAYYEQANYGDAVKEFNEAYRLSQRPDLLYNIALAYERLERWDEAVAALERYLALKPDAQDRNLIRTRIENLQKRRATAQAAPPAPAPPPTAPTPPAPAKKPRHVASLTVGGIGVAALIAAVGTGAAALRDKSELDAVCQNGLCPPAKQNQIDEGHRLALSTDILIGIGAAAVLTGVILLVVESRRPPPAARTAAARPAASAAARSAAAGLLVRF
jgi:tetratricopeptide (TPR) repeat protein